MEHYTYIYLDARARLNTATNPRFIAKHKACIAIPTMKIAEYTNGITNFLYQLNSYDELPSYTKELVYETDLIEILPQSMINHIQHYFEKE